MNAIRCSASCDHDDGTDINNGATSTCTCTSKSKSIDMTRRRLFSYDDNTFALLQVRNAQKAGASGVLIADNTCLCGDKECMEETNAETCENSEPIMADDGSGGDITIPSFLMFKHDADRVKVQLKDDHPVQMEMVWSLPAPDDRVEYELWTVPSDKVSRNFLIEFKDVAMALGERAEFAPHMYVFDGVRTHCQGKGGENFCYNLCTNKGRYCATDPDNDLDRGISGADVVTESLRRLCIWDHYGRDNGVGEQWWNYIFEFDKRCNTEDYFSSKECVVDCFDHSGIETEKIDRCMSDSGGLENDVSNAFLDKEIARQAERGVVVLPTAFVNTAALRGQLSTANVFSAICAGYAEGTRPDICDQCSLCSDISACAKTGRCSSSPVPSSKSSSSSTSTSSSDGVSTHSFAFSLLFVIAVFSAAGVWHYNKTRQDMRDQVRGILSEYMPLDDQDAAPGASPMDFARQGGSQSLIS